MKTACRCGGMKDKGTCDRCGTTTSKERTGSTARGYDYQWQKLRKRILKRHPLCVDCMRNEIATEATEVHHVLKITHRPDLRLDEDNLMPLCSSCHAIRSGRGE